MLGEEFGNIKKCYRDSIKIIDKLNELAKEKGVKDFCLVVNGSLARKELSASSDFDAFLICRDSLEKEKAECREFWVELQKLSGLGSPGSTGTFSENDALNIQNIVQDVGGLNDDNIKITKRMLFILESMPLGDISVYEELRDRIIERYISEKITNHQLGLFLLNDIIRYYRTICVDFEYKTVEAGKNWGLRNIKLVYSRKLIYFSGVVMCAEMAQKSAKEKRTLCRNMMSLTPVERLIQVFGVEIYKPLRIYDEFLGKISDPEIRNEIDTVDPHDRSASEMFTNLKNDGHHFSWGLRSAFMKHYDSTHPIHKAILF